MIAIYKKGYTHNVASESEPTLLLPCEIVRVPNNEDRLALIAHGDHFDTVDELHAPPKSKKGRNKSEKAPEVVESGDATEGGESEDENENPAD